jgi:hypothetical protein
MPSWSTKRSAIWNQRVKPDGPVYQTLKFAALRRHPEILETVQTALLTRRLLRPKAAPKLALPGHQLVTALSRNELWRRAKDALPGWLDPALRDDVTADVVVAVLEGRLAIDDVNRDSVMAIVR